MIRHDDASGSGTADASVGWGLGESAGFSFRAVISSECSNDTYICQAGTTRPVAVYVCEADAKVGYAPCIRRCSVEPVGRPGTYPTLMTVRQLVADVKSDPRPTSLTKASSFNILCPCSSTEEMSLSSCLSGSSARSASGSFFVISLSLCTHVEADDAIPPSPHHPKRILSRRSLPSRPPCAASRTSSRRSRPRRGAA